MAAAKDPGTVRVQVYLTDAKIIAALSREARASRLSLSQAAGRAIGQGLRRSPKADVDDRLLQMERKLGDHVRANSRDLAIVQGAIVQLARDLHERLPDSWADRDPQLRAAADIAEERFLDRVAARMISGRRMEDGRRADADASDRG